MENESANIQLVREECVPDSLPTATVAPVEGFALQVQSIEGNADASRKSAAKKRKLIANAIIIMMDSSSSESDDDEEIHLWEQLRPNEIFLFYNERNPRNCVENYVEEI
ncbi:PREDICTED: uncharacterized protein LOC108355354, partial [Rhagoletis zephyria]|uniref:uncharacterized protein LOC108355354 n=1 Tax=Rhagoletis zephyria TaxID=28612 RepID=UPI0008116C41